MNSFISLLAIINFIHTISELRNFKLAMNLIFVNNYHCYINFLLMKQINEKKYSVAKAYRLKPQDYLSNTFYKRGKTFFNSDTQEPTIDPFRKTDAFAITRNMKDFIKRASPSPTRGDNERIKRRKASGSKGGIFRIEKSPYISNTTEIQRMLKLMVPVRGPNESLKLQIKRHNELNFRNAELLIVKKSQNFQDRMKAYSSRMGLPEDTKIYMINSRDSHIKAALNRRGWIESTQKSSVLFHLKWVYKDDLNDYQMLQQGQFYNHFRNNQQLTNKNNLRKNIKKSKIQEKPHFPISFDIELNDDNSSFQQTFIKFEAFKLLNSIGKYLSNKNYNLYSKMLKNSLFFENQRNKPSDKNRQINFDILYTRSQTQIKQDKGFSETYSNLFEYFCFIADEISKQKSIYYSIFRLKKENKQILKITKKVQQQFFLGAECMFQDLSTFYITQILKMWHHSQQIFSNSYGVENMWIIKPTGVSRGSGITITNDSSRIMQLRYGKIVQKYIEYPLLLECKRKFDIRQWVLVTSFHPLRAYAFKRCYARFSSQKYSNDKYENMQKHLTNYSQNKESYLRQKLHLKDNLSKSPPNMSAMAEEELSQKIGEKWQKIKSQFYADIIKTLNCCKSDIIQKQGCFEVYGFDIIIDQNYQPYILEVNLSPACQERQFLHQYLEEMADGLINMIEGGEPEGWIQLVEKVDCRINNMKLFEQKIRFIQSWWRNRLQMMEKRRGMIITEL